MCENCWSEYGAPALINERTRAAAAMIARVYEFNDVGGNLHSIVDDWNLDDDDFAEDEMPVYHDAGPEQLEAERAAWGMLKGMSLPERPSALALPDRFLGAVAP